MRTVTGRDPPNDGYGPRARGLHHGGASPPAVLGRSASGMTTTALVGAGHTPAQTPHPVHTSSRIRGFPAFTSIAPATGHRSEQTVQNEPVWARHAIV